MSRLAVRVTVLGVALLVALAWAYQRTHTRAQRRTWDRTLGVLVYALGAGDADGVAALQRSLDQVAVRLAEDRSRYGPGPAPLRFEVVGPVASARTPPIEPPGPSWTQRLAFEAALWRAERAVRAAAPEPDPRAFDVRVYLVLGAGAGRSFAEGVAEAGGEVAVVHAALGPDALLAATAVAHEALHTLGATDKYDEAGHALPPAGLYEPERAPPYPQVRAELMVGEVPLAPDRGRLAEEPGELGVGPETARELGWLPP